VVLIDGDLRKGVLHHVLGAKREPGLAEILRSADALESCIQSDPALGFSFIGSGSVARNTGDLLLGPGFAQLLAKLQQRFDYVLIDSSPVFAADDASTLAPKVDGTLFVVRNGYSGAKLVREALALLYQRQARVLGVVFNRTNASSRSYYYYKYADYYPDPATKAAGA
jgi:tyrosine-protein kinase Etk/Wzc